MGYSVSQDGINDVLNEYSERFDMMDDELQEESSQESPRDPCFTLKLDQEMHPQEVYERCGVGEVVPQCRTLMRDPPPHRVECPPDRRPDVADNPASPVLHESCHPVTHDANLMSSPAKN